MSTEKGRKNNSASRFQDTIVPMSAEQGMLIKQDEIITEMNAMVQVLTFLSAAGAGGNASEAMVVTGLLANDTILAVSQEVKGANNLPLLAYNTQAADALTGVWSADPGAGAKIRVTVSRARTEVKKVDLK